MFNINAIPLQPRRIRSSAVRRLPRYAALLTGKDFPSAAGRLLISPLPWTATALQAAWRSASSAVLLPTARNFSSACMKLRLCHSARGLHAPQHLTRHR